jgi:hypothetical protein
MYDASDALHAIQVAGSSPSRGGSTGTGASRRLMCSWPSNGKLGQETKDGRCAGVSTTVRPYPSGLAMSSTRSGELSRISMIGPVFHVKQADDVFRRACLALGPTMATASAEEPSIGSWSTSVEFARAGDEFAARLRAEFMECRRRFSDVGRRARPRGAFAGKADSPRPGVLVTAPALGKWMHGAVRCQLPSTDLGRSMFHVKPTAGQGSNLSRSGLRRRFT